jgi:hypothetical protein
MMRPRTGQAVLEYEMREDQAVTMGRLSRELRSALDALNGFEKRPSTATMAADRRRQKRADLVDAASYALWHFVVQLECSGFRTIDRLLEEYAVPPEVRARMGAIRPR